MKTINLFLVLFLGLFFLSNSFTKHEKSYLKNHSPGIESTTNARDLLAESLNNIDLPEITGNCPVHVPIATYEEDEFGDLLYGTTDDPLIYEWVGEYFITWTFLDNNGNSFEAEQRIEVIDETPPTINCPDDLTLYSEPGVCSVFYEYEIMGSGNCSEVSIDHMNGPPSGSEIGVGESFIKFKATNESGVYTECSWTVTVIDNHPPELICPPSINVESSDGNCSAIVAIGGEQIEDFCGLREYIIDVEGISYTSYIAAYGLQARPIIFGPDGFLYASNFTRGEDGKVEGTVNKYDVNNASLELEIGGPSGSTSLAFPRGLAFGTDGNLYVASNNSHEILRFDPNSGDLIDAFVPAGSGGLSYPTGLLFGPDGNLYVCDRGSNVVKRYDPSTGDYIDDFVAPGSGGLDFPIGCTFGPDGHFYVVNAGADAINRYDGITGEFLDQFISSGSGGLSIPEALEFGPDGHLYVTSFLSGEVLKYDGKNGAFIESVVPQAFNLSNPDGLTFGPDGHLYVSNQGQGQIIRVPSMQEFEFPVGTTNINVFVTDHSGNESSCTYSVNVKDTQGPIVNCPESIILDADPENCVASTILSLPDINENCGIENVILEVNGEKYTDFTFVASGSGGLDGPRPIIFGPDGHLYVSNLNRNSNFGNILRYDGSSGAFLDEFVPASDELLQFPRGLRFGPDGHLYVASYLSNEILKFDGTTGDLIETFVPQGGNLFRPTGIVFGPNNDLFVSNRGTGEILRYDGATGVYEGIFASGLNFPVGLIFGPDDHLYVANLGEDEILRFNGENGDFIDAFVTAGEGGLISPEDIEFGPDGHLYVTSFYTGQVLQYDGITGDFLDDVSAGGPTMYYPEGMTFGPDDNLYVAAYGNNAIFKYPTAPVNFQSGEHTLRYTATDFSGLSTSCTYQIFVNDLENVEIIHVELEPDPVALGMTNLAYGDFYDECDQDDHEALWYWGDGTSSSGLVDQVENKVSGSHVYSNPGVYIVSLEVFDLDGSDSKTATAYAVVYDPDGGFVTGGGWIQSPLSAYTPDPELTGKANFGFVAKYKKGTNIPDGNTTFQFNAAQFKFKSTAYEWLVIAGARAKFKGEGQVNNSGNYKFMLTGIDGDQNGGGGTDQFRIKIWDALTDNIVYDNKLGADEADYDTQELGGGEIQIHKGSNALMYKTVLTNARYDRTSLRTKETQISKVKNFDFIVSPNPTSDFINIKPSNFSHEKAQILIMDQLGKTIFHQSFDTRSGKIDISVNNNNIQAGIYMISVISGDKMKTKRLIVVK